MTNDTQHDPEQAPPIQGVVDQAVTTGAQGHSDDVKTVKLVYFLYLASVVVGLTSLIGVIMAYVNRGTAPAWLQSHYHFQIRTFWIGLIFVVVGGLLSVVVVGIFLLLFTLVWFILRCVKGLSWLEKGQPVPDPGSWLFS